MEDKMVSYSESRLENNLQRLERFVKKYGQRLPMTTTDDREEATLAQWRYSIYKQEKDGTLTDETRQLIENILPTFFDAKHRSQRRSFIEIVDDLASFYRTHGRPPQQSQDADETENYHAVTQSRLLAQYRKNLFSRDKVRYIDDTYPEFFKIKYRRRKNQNERVEELKEWYRKKGYRPRVYIEEERDLAQWVNNQMYTDNSSSVEVRERKELVRELVNQTSREPDKD